MIKKIIFILLIFLSMNVYPRDFHMYAAAGITFSPSSFRIGYGDWEGGLINQSIGFDKIFTFGNSYYSTFGFLIDGNIGFYTGMGMKYNLWFIPLRMELAASFRSNGDTSSSGLFGVTYGF